jgi:hypothetical protein
MSWGYRIAIGYGAFVVLTITLVVLAFQHDVNLIAKDYYSQELEFQNQIDSHNNLVALEEKMELRALKAAQQLNISFPAASIAADTQGSIQFFRPSDGSLDFEMKFDGSEGKDLSYSTAQMPKGYWRIKINWTSAGKAYFFEQPVQL